MTARDRRAVLIGALVVGGAFLGFRMIPSVVGRVRTAHAELQARAQIVARSREDVVNAPLLEDSAGQVREALLGLTPKLVGGGSQAEAVAALAGLLNLAASRNRTRLGSIDPVADSVTAGRLGQVTVRVSLESDWAGLLETITAIESGDPVLIVSEARLTASDPASPSNAAEVIRAEVTVRGWYLRGQPLLEEDA